MKKYEIVKKNDDFNDIIKTGKFISNKSYIIYYKVSDVKFPRFGLAVSKKCGNAVRRNKIKRQLRMIVDNNKKLFAANRDYIIMVKKDILNLKFQDMEEKLVSLLEKGNKNEKN